MLRIQLDVRRALDLDALERGQTIFTHRCFARLRFQRATGWSEERLAILDTGAPFSVIPATVWAPLRVTRLFPAPLRGLIPKASATVPAQLARVSAVLTDEERVSPPLELTAMLVEEPDVPLILGWEGCLDQTKLFLDSAHNLAWLEF